MEKKSVIYGFKMLITINFENVFCTNVILYKLEFKYNPNYNYKGPVYKIRLQYDTPNILLNISVSRSCQKL